MAKSLLMGNVAFGLGAIRSGVNIVCGYPGTPSTEVLETVAGHNPDQKIHVEWSTNEKAALEVAAGASYSGARVLVTMKQVGLNVASDPLMSLTYIGVKGGVVLLVADDPGPISSQTEQDTRRFGSFSKVPVLDPVDSAEAYAVMPYAFELSEKYHTPVIVRSTTRVSHGGGVVDVVEGYEANEVSGFERDPKWVIFPRRAYEAHLDINRRLPLISDEYCQSPLNSVTDIKTDGADKTVGIAAGGDSYLYVMEALSNPAAFGLDGAKANFKVFKVGTPFPFPDKLGEQFIRACDDIVCFEELDPTIEDGLVAICGRKHIDMDIHGRTGGTCRNAGENSPDTVASDLRGFLAAIGAAGDASTEKDAKGIETSIKLPPRPPVLCSGCPHRGAFYAVKVACRGRKARFSGDIGCYTLGNAMPLDMVDDCLCMGAGITMAQGMNIADPEGLDFAFIGDSTFFASGITGVVNSVYNGNPIKLMVLDNSTTAMTGHQPHPGTGVRMSDRPTGQTTTPIDIEAILKAIGVSPIVTCDPNNLDEAVSAVKSVMDAEGTSAVIFKSPCAAIITTGKVASIDQEKCTGCKSCIRQIGCPAIMVKGGAVNIDDSLCNGCGLCTYICKFDAIKVGDVR